MDPAADQYYRWLTVIAGPVFYNLMMIVTRYCPVSFFTHKGITEIPNMLCLSSRSCFNELQDRFTKLWLFLDYTADFIYYTDTFVRSRTGRTLENVYVRM